MSSWGRSMSSAVYSLTIGCPLIAGPWTLTIYPTKRKRMAKAKKAAPKKGKKGAK